MYVFLRLCFCGFGGDVLHIGHFLFHIGDQCELRAAADKIVFRIFCFEVNLLVQVVRQKAHAAFKGHQLCRKRQIFDFTRPKALFCRG